MPPASATRAAIELRRPSLRQHEVAFLLGRSVSEVRNMLRRGERLRDAGVPSDEIVAGGALPVCPDGVGRRTVPSLALADHPIIAASPLRQAALVAVVEDRMRAPKAASDSERPPEVVDRAHLL